MTEDRPDPSPVSRHRRSWIACIALLILTFWAHALLASRDKSSTYDEPVHVFSSWLIVNHHDFRLSPEHPALWKYIIGLGTYGVPLNVDLNAPKALNVIQAPLTFPEWVTQVLYQSPPAGASALYGEQLVERARIANSIFLILIACILSRWAWVWGGPVAAVVTTALLAFDPNFLGHGGLATNDVAVSGAIALACFYTWRLGERFTAGRLIAMALTCTAALCIKLSSMLLIPMLGLPLLFRAVDPSAWPIGNGQRFLKLRTSRLAAVTLAIGFSMAVFFVTLWGLYGYRYAATADGKLLNDDFVNPYRGYDAAVQQVEKKTGQTPSTEWQNQHLWMYRPGLSGSVFWWMETRQLLPQPWTWGLNYLRDRSIARASFLLGTLSLNGFFWFFPLNVLFKTPVVTLCIAAATFAGGIMMLKRKWREPGCRWMAVCAVVPPAAFFLSAMSSNVNIGIRHILPIYPPAFVACGVVIAKMLPSKPQLRPMIVIALLLLAAETTSVFPNYISFFNRPSSGAAGGFRLLSDSNLDWGQDLPAMARWYTPWRAANPNRPFHFLYFGSADPLAYGIGLHTPPAAATDRLTGIYAVSATILQGLCPPEMTPIISQIRVRRPIAVINDTIYLYDLDRN